jgi:hypothetical protein
MKISVRLFNEELKSTRQISVKCVDVHNPNLVPSYQNFD